MPRFLDSIPSTPLKILHVMGSTDTPGAGELLSVLDRHAHRAGLVHERFVRATLARRWHDPLRLAPLRTAIASSGAGLLQCHDFYSALAVHWAGSALPVIHTLHQPFHRLSWLERRGYRRLLERAGVCVVAVSVPVRRSFVFGAGPSARAIETIPLGLEPVGDADARRARLVQTLGLAAGDLLVGAPEAMTERAGHRFLLDAWRALPAALRRRAVLVLRAEGPLRAELTGGLPEGVVVVSAGLAELLPACDVVVWSSLYGELPEAAGQAMAAGRVVIATSPGGIAEQVERGVEALVVPSQDAAALAAALRGVLGDAGARRCLGRAARSLFERRFATTVTADAWAAVYARVVADIDLSPRAD